MRTSKRYSQRNVAEISSEENLHPPRNEDLEADGLSLDDSTSYQDQRHRNNLIHQALNSVSGYLGHQQQQRQEGRRSQASRRSSNNDESSISTSASVHIIVNNGTIQFLGDVETDTSGDVLMADIVDCSSTISSTQAGALLMPAGAQQAAATPRMLLNNNDGHRFSQDEEEVDVDSDFLFRDEAALMVPAAIRHPHVAAAEAALNDLSFTGSSIRPDGTDSLQQYNPHLYHGGDDDSDISFLYSLESGTQISSLNTHQAAHDGGNSEPNADASSWGTGPGPMSQYPHSREVPIMPEFFVAAGNNQNSSRMMDNDDYDDQISRGSSSTHFSNPGETSPAGKTANTSATSVLVGSFMSSSPSSPLRSQQDKMKSLARGRFRDDQGDDLEKRKKRRKMWFGLMVCIGLVLLIVGILFAVRDKRGDDTPVGVSATSRGSNVGDDSSEWVTAFGTTAVGTTPTQVGFSANSLTEPESSTAASSSTSATSSTLETDSTNLPETTRTSTETETTTGSIVDSSSSVAQIPTTQAPSQTTTTTQEESSSSSTSTMPETTVVGGTSPTTSTATSVETMPASSTLTQSEQETSTSVTSGDTTTLETPSSSVPVVPTTTSMSSTTVATTTASATCEDGPELIPIYGAPTSCAEIASKTIGFRLTICSANPTVTNPVVAKDVCVKTCGLCP